MDGGIVLGLYGFVVAQPRLADLTVLMAELGVFVLPLLLAVSWMIPGQTLATRRRAVLAGCLAAVFAIGVGMVLERVLGRPRPFVELGFAPLIAHVADSSVPSDHTLVGVALVGPMLFSVPRGPAEEPATMSIAAPLGQSIERSSAAARCEILAFRPNSSRLGIGMFVWALLVGVARVAAGLHYPSDIIGTAVLALGIDVVAMRVATVVLRGRLP